MNSVAISLDFNRMPVELELRYSNVQDDDVYRLQILDDDAIDDLRVDGNIDNWGIAGKLDLSWNCTTYCLYLMAGYNSGELTLDARLNGSKIGSYSTDANYTHWGAGFRYDFTNHLRASLEYLSYNMGKQKLDDIDDLDVEVGKVDLGTATAWQAGIAYRF